MAADSQKTAGQAAREKVEKREQVEDAVEQANESAAAVADDVRAEDPRSTEEVRIDVEPGTVEPGSLTETGADGDKPTEQLRQEVEEAREELADTVTELGRKVDPRPKVEAAGAQAKHQARQYGPAVGAGVALLVVAVLVWRRRR